MTRTALLVIDCQMEFSRRTAGGIPRSNRDAEAIGRNADVMAQLQGAGGFVPRPWLDEQGRRAFLEPFARWWAQLPGAQV